MPPNTLINTLTNGDGQWASPATAWLLTAIGAVATDLLLRPRLDALLAPAIAPIAVLATGLLILLPPLWSRRAPLRDLLLSALMIGLLVGFCQTLLAAPLPAGALIFDSAITALLLFCAGAAVLSAPPPLRPAAHAFMLLVLVLLTLSPVWLAAWLDALARRSGVLDALIAINPLTALCAASGTDFVRMDWLYRHSPLGSLRFDYPPPGLLLAGYGLLAAGLAVLLPARHMRLPTARAPATDRKST